MCEVICLFPSLLVVETSVISGAFMSPPLCSSPCLGADVPETEAGGGKGEAASRAGALQEVLDAATDTLA